MIFHSFSVSFYIWSPFIRHFQSLPFVSQLRKQMIFSVVVSLNHWKVNISNNKRRGILYSCQKPRKFLCSVKIMQDQGSSWRGFLIILVVFFFFLTSQQGYTNCFGLAAQTARGPWMSILHRFLAESVHMGGLFRVSVHVWIGHAVEQISWVLRIIFISSL